MFVSRRSLLALLFVVVALPRARAEGVARYNDTPPPVRRSPLAARLEALGQRVAEEQRRDVPMVDRRLELACASLLPYIPDGAPPDNELVEEALRLQGIIEPSPHLVVVGAGEDGEEALLAELGDKLPAVLKQGHYRRMGVAVGPDAPGRLRILIAFQESFVELQPVPRELPQGGRAPLDGRVLPPYRNPSLLITHPDGRVMRAPLSVADGRVQALFQCGPTPGGYEIEITGDDRFGPAVLANFPVYCGARAPMKLVAPNRAPEPPWTDGADAEAQVFAELNADRAHAGLPPLALDARLSEVARAHSEDMRLHGFVGHVSPTTGSADDRLRRVHIVPPLVLENVGRAYSPREAERGLMDSPGHRANILSSAASRVGVGVSVVAGGHGERELLVTQLFIHVPAPFDAGRTPAELRRRVDALRRQSGLGPLVPDAELDALALEVARGIVAGTIAPEHPGAPVERALPRLADRFRTLRTVVVLDATEPGEIQTSPAMIDRRITHAGEAVLPRKSERENKPLCIVLILGAHR